MFQRNLSLKKSIKLLTLGGVGVLPTDTIYGLVGSALNRKAVERIYRLKRRNPKKSMIVLIGGVDDLLCFGIVPSPQTKRLFQKVWPAKISIVLPSTKGESLSPEFSYLERGAEGLAFRLPRPLWLRKLLMETGPLVAPSANFENEPPALTIQEAKNYFGKSVDFYVDVGKLVSKPSTLIKIRHGKIKVLRQGAVKL